MDYKNRVRNLEQRRQGTRFVPTMDGYSVAVENFALPKEEAFTKIQFPDSVKYAIGSMQAVDEDYTKKSYEEGDRVANQLKQHLEIPVDTDYQGSVPLNVHIKGNSDIDLLLLCKQFVTVDESIRGNYTDYKGKSATDELIDLRAQAAKVLRDKYPRVTVDDSPGKAIALSGGSLARAVDVIPSHWHDTKEYHETRLKKHREIYVLDSKTNSRVNNKPFLHIALVDEKCNSVRGSLRKVIRLLKNLKYDAEPEVRFTSYDIVAVCYHMTQAELTVPFGLDLLLLDRVQKHLELTVSNASYRNMLAVPDGSRKIFDQAEKLNGLVRLKQELESLIKDLARELNPLADYLPRETVLNKSVLL
jgi:hypothetical protein